jgi:hypothetical protein
MSWHMKIEAGSLKCYVAVLQNLHVDSYLEQNGFCRGLLAFAIPSHGILFRCRADGTAIDLEFAAFFSLLEFLSSDLRDEPAKNILVLSSTPEFVFSFSGASQHLQEGNERHRLLAEHSRRFRLSIQYIEPFNNKALFSPGDYPSLPAANLLKLKTSDRNFGKQSFKPFQKGIKL